MATKEGISWACTYARSAVAITGPAWWRLAVNLRFVEVDVSSLKLLPPEISTSSLWQ